MNYPHPKKMIYSFLHVSDLHYRNNWPEGIDVVFRCFIDDVKVQLGNFPNCYLTFSGDLVQSSGESSAYESLATLISGPLLDLGIPPERRICVPGNHDVSRNALQPLLLMQRGVLSQIQDEQSFNDQLPLISASIFEPKFRDYISYENTFAKYTTCTSGLGGAGWELSEGIGIYCLNTSLCSYAGLDGTKGGPTTDRNQLAIDTRSLHRWLAETKSNIRILVMHHPTNWLIDWNENELERIVQKHFHLVISGHNHDASTLLYSRPGHGAVRVAAPALFSKKTDVLGYSFITLNTVTRQIQVTYRQWSQTGSFVLGTVLAGNDKGFVQFDLSQTEIPPVDPPQLLCDMHLNDKHSTLEILTREHEKRLTCYSSKNNTWVNRDLSDMSDASSERDKATVISPLEFAKSPRSCVIRAPQQFGLTCLGRFIAVEYHRSSSKGDALVVVDSSEVPPHKFDEYFRERCGVLCIQKQQVAGVILDHWTGDDASRKMLRHIQKNYSDLIIIVLHSLEDGTQVANVFTINEIANYETLYLLALSRNQIRELVTAYLQNNELLDENVVLKKLIDDIDSLNIHRTPLNCLLILKMLEQTFDDSPVNRTEMIGRVLQVLFFQFNKIPRYATRPDIKDCEYALGYVAEWLLRSSRFSFSKLQFYDKIREYCALQLIEIDSEVLFAFLVFENILVQRSFQFEFRFRYWLYFFAAHRMHHNSVFAEYIFEQGRYSAYPEVIEFYTGIDRRRVDAVTKLTNDLHCMNAEFQARLGVSESFNPLQNAVWAPDDTALKEMQKEVTDGVAESSLPNIVKDAIADRSYDPSQPYNQMIAKFFNESSLFQMIQTMRGAARALRNSDYVLPAAKMALLNEIIYTWHKVVQVLILIAPILAERMVASFEDTNFYLSDGFSSSQTKSQRFRMLLTVILDNVVQWYENDISSRKLGPLFANYINDHQGELHEVLILLLISRQRPAGWEKLINRFVQNADKNSLYLQRIYSSMVEQFKTSYCNEETRQQLRHLAAMSLARHDTGAKKPDVALMKRATRAIDKA